MGFLFFRGQGDDVGGQGRRFQGEPNLPLLGHRGERPGEDRLRHAPRKSPAQLLARHPGAQGLLAVEAAEGVTHRGGNVRERGLGHVERRALAQGQGLGPTAERLFDRRRGNGQARGQGRRGETGGLRLLEQQGGHLREGQVRGLQRAHQLQGQGAPSLGRPRVEDARATDGDGG